MRRDVFYMAHPLRPTQAEIDGERCGAWATMSEAWFTARATDRNVIRARHSLAWLRVSFPETTFIAPWITSIDAGADDADPAQREAGILDACAVIERCDGIVLRGDRISDGMARERDYGVHNVTGFIVADIRNPHALSLAALAAIPREKHRWWTFRDWVENAPVRG